MTGTRYAEAITLGNFDGSVSSQGDAAILSEGSINGSLSALKDGYVYAFGPVTGGFSAARDLGVLSFRSVHAGISAGRDLIYVRAVGNIDGALSAGHNIGGPWEDPDRLGSSITSYGAIGLTSATISAGRDILGGTAIGPISGTIVAGNEIGGVRSGDAISATVSAVGAVLSEDFVSAIAALTAPVTPGTTAGSVTAAVTLARDEVLQAVADALASFAFIQTQLATAKTEAANQFATVVADHTSAVSQLLSPATAMVHAAETAYSVALQAEQAGALQATDAAFSDDAGTMAAIASDAAKAVTSNNQLHAQRIVRQVTAQNSLTSVSINVGQRRAGAILAMAGMQSHFEGSRSRGAEE